MPVTTLDRVPVVTAFLTREGRVLLLRRSVRVGTYQGRWAGVSGYVERVPLEQAYVELAEETGLRASSVRLQGIGVPVAVDDESAGRHWLVYPFLFALKPGQEVRLDWESAEHEWTEPEAVAEFETVPGLTQVLESVWPAFGSAGLWRAARRIARDRVSGATELARQALAALEAFVRSSSKPGGDDLLRAARGLAALRPSMAVIPHVMALAVQSPERATGIREQLTEAADRSAELAADALADAECVLTYSASAVCEKALRSWAAQTDGAEAIAAESRPKNEGTALAERLSAEGVRVRLITDAQLGLATRQADAVLVGADAITDDDRLINKAGTELVVLAAREFGTKAYAVCQTHKIAPPGWPIALEHQEPTDVHRTEAFRVENVVFDATPLAWFEEIITERGALTAELLAEVRADLAGSCLVP